MRRALVLAEVELSAERPQELDFLRNGLRLEAGHNVAAGITFGMEKDYRFVGIAVFVLMMILLAVFIRL